MYVFFFFLQAEDGIRDLVRSRGLGDVYKRQARTLLDHERADHARPEIPRRAVRFFPGEPRHLHPCLLYTSDAADDLLCVDLGGRRFITKKKQKKNTTQHTVEHYGNKSRYKV